MDLVLPESLDAVVHDKKIVKENTFIEELTEVKKLIINAKIEYGKDVHQNNIKIGDFIGRYEEGNINVFVVCSESNRTFYLARYTMLQNFIDDSISNINDIRKFTTYQILKKNCGKAIILEENSLNEIIRDKMTELQDKILKIQYGTDN